MNSTVSHTNDVK